MVRLCLAALFPFVPVMLEVQLHQQTSNSHATAETTTSAATSSSAMCAGRNENRPEDPEFHLHVENMRITMKPPRTDAEHVSTVDPKSAEYGNHTGSHLPEESAYALLRQTSTEQLTAIYKGP